ncbi:MAG: hypothetical protein QME58_12170 [Bacteroidota bacterium]|nr:hypothetical protein [Bacteroidota bacterium]
MEKQIKAFAKYFLPIIPLYSRTSAARTTFPYISAQSRLDVSRDGLDGSERFGDTAGPEAVPESVDF